MITLTKSERRYISTNNHGCIELNGKNYYFKITAKSCYGVEGVVEKLAKKVGLKCAHYEYVTIGEYDYVLSEDLSEGGLFVTAEELGINGGSLYDVWNILEKKFPDKSRYLMMQMVKIYLFDILLLNEDRNLGNYGFRFIGGTTDEELEDIYIFDNEFAFYLGRVLLSSKYDEDDKLSNPVTMSEEAEEFYEPSFGETYEPIIRELEYFLATSSEEFTDLFREMYSILTPDVVENEFKKYNSSFKKYMIKTYKKHYAFLGELLNKRGLK